MSKTARRIVLYGAATLVVLAGLAVAAALVIPELLDSPARAAEIQARLSRAVRGETESRITVALRAVTRAYN